MFIKCKQIREGGTEIKLGETVYHFAPNKDGDHVAEVTDKAHIERLLSIEEAFEEHGTKAAKSAPAKIESAPDESAEDSNEEQGVTAADINAMGKKELMELAAANELTLNEAAPVATLRKQVVKLLGLE